MKKILFCLAATCLFALGSFAQTSGSSSMSQGSMSKDQTTTTTTKTKTTKTAKTSAAKEVALTGCIEAGKEANEYMLKTRTQKNIELETTEDLKPHVGHTVKVSGNWDRQADKTDKHEMGGGTEKGEHKEAKGERHFKVDKLDMVSDTCTVTKATSKTKKPS